MAFGWRVSSTLIGAVALWALVDASSAVAAPIRPEKDKDVEYGKKLVGTWVYKDDAKNGGPSSDFTIEFKAGGGLKMSVDQGKFELSGTWKSVKEDGKSITIDVELSLDGPAGMKSQQKTLSIVFEDGDTIVISAVGDKADPRTLKRKP
jgi:hypothetical protein